MSRSHVLLHCSNARLSAARAEAWEGKDPGGVRVLLVNPRWEKRFLKFLELSGVGRVVAGRDHGRVDALAAAAASRPAWSPQVSLSYLKLRGSENLP